MISSWMCPFRGSRWATFFPATHPPTDILASGFTPEKQSSSRPVLLDRADLDAATMAGGRDRGSECDRRRFVVGLEHEIAPDRTAGAGVRSLAGDDLAVLDTDRLRLRRQTER